ncbi:inorganic diphosphatase [Aurantiacibacter sediminis]|uniref:inorganic diphosphatase n=1 Tax=Aurantiacibacter sediminis TaxID=2793064 RepID=A0ABS0MZ56_9SPHN|nr:inorganic diphosphatase [Aurantiacibacter sediminis]MBH5320998.1 inorganic diphosphatase [Aurantiacibacter sediminis]
MIGQADIGSIPARDDNGLLQAFIECPSGSRHKVDLDKKLGVMRWALELPAGVTFPANFGFVPSTLADDGDALDVIVLAGGPLPSGSIVAVRPVAVLAMSQTENGEMVRNDRIVCVPPLCRSYGEMQDLGDLRTGLMWELGDFFRSYNHMIDRDIEVHDAEDREAAEQAVEKAITAYEHAQ